MITTKTRIAIIENNSPFSALLKGMLFKVGVLSQFHFSSVSKFTEQVEKGHMQFDFVLLNSSLYGSEVLSLIEKKKIRFLVYGERSLMTAEAVHKIGLSKLIELPFTGERLLQKLESTTL